MDTRTKRYVEVLSECDGEENFFAFRWTHIRILRRYYLISEWNGYLFFPGNEYHPTRMSNRHSTAIFHSDAGGSIEQRHLLPVAWEDLEMTTEDVIGMIEQQAERGPLLLEIWAIETLGYERWT